MAAFTPAPGLVPTSPAAGAAEAGSPPGLWQPPPGIGADGEKSDLQKEIATTIESQVSRLIEQARIDTETKVKMELKQIRVSMMAMDERLDQMIKQLDGVQPQESAEPVLQAEEVNHFLSKTEHQWGQEIRTLKQELHQTILAHNHNADLIKHHKDTIDALRDRCVKMQGSSLKNAEIQNQLKQLDARLKQQQKYRKLEPLFERLSALEMRVAAASQGFAWGGYPNPRMPAASASGVTATPPGMLPSAAGAVAPGLKAAKDEEVAAKLSKLSLGAAEAAPVGPVSHGSEDAETPAA